MAKQRYVVTGAGGFVGLALTKALIQEGHEVIGISRAEYPELRAIGAQSIRADIAESKETLRKVFAGVDAVFHVAAKVDMWGDYRDFYRTNLVGTRNVVLACQEQGVRKLIFTSSPSVIADGKDLVRVDESYPYPIRHMAHYPATKAMAEREVLMANGHRGLWTLALRPHLIFGPGDQHFVPTILARARVGKLVQVGSGKNLTDLTFIDDCVRAHICAVSALENNPASRGQVYFVSQGEPVNMWQWINEVLVRNQVPRITRRIPSQIALSLAYIFEFGARLSPGYIEPLFTRFLVSQMSTSHYFDISRAARDLDFSPRFKMKEAMNLTFGETTLDKAAEMPNTSVVVNS